MSRSSTRSRSRTVLYVAATEGAARDGAAALERAAPDDTVRTATSVDRVRDAALEADCVVFAETPTAAAGSHLLEVVDAAGSTPLVLFSDSSYAPSAARSTDGIDGYVRRDAEDAAVHLADEIEWVCRGDGTSGGADPGREPDVEAAAVLFETAAEIADCRDRERLFERVVEGAVDAFGFERCWLSTVDFGEFVPRAAAPAVPDGAIEPIPTDGPLGKAFRAGELAYVPDLEDAEGIGRPIEGIRSLCSVPVGNVGVLQAAADEPDAFDEADLVLLAGHCAFAAAILDRNWIELGILNERDRVRRDRERLETECDLLADEFDLLLEGCRELGEEYARLETELEGVKSERDLLEAELERLEEERDLLEDECDSLEDACKQLESGRARLEEELERVASDRSLFEHHPDPAVRYEFDGDRPLVRDVNGAFEETFGTDGETVVGGIVGEHTIPRGLEDRATALVEALRSGERRRLVAHCETVEGGRKFRLTNVPLESSASRAATGTAGLLVYRDVTESRRLERELAVVTERLEAIEELVDEGVREPLNVARGYLELAETTGDREHFEVIEGAHDRLRDRVDELLETTLGDDEGIVAESVDVHDVARLAWIDAETGEARLVTEDELVLEADGERLRELFENAFGAAVEGVGEEGNDGGEPVTVTVGATDDGFYVAGARPAVGEGDGGRDVAPSPGRLGTADGTGFQVDAVERIADAHGWDVGVAEDEEGTAFAFRGVDVVEGN